MILHVILVVLLAVYSVNFILWGVWMWVRMLTFDLPPMKERIFNLLVPFRVIDKF